MLRVVICIIGYFVCSELYTLLVAVGTMLCALNELRRAGSNIDYSYLLDYGVNLAINCDRQYLNKIPLIVLLVFWPVTKTIELHKWRIEYFDAIDQCIKERVELSKEES